MKGILRDHLRSVNRPRTNDLDHARKQFPGLCDRESTRPEFVNLCSMLSHAKIGGTLLQANRISHARYEGA